MATTRVRKSGGGPLAWVSILAVTLCAAPAGAGSNLRAGGGRAEAPDNYDIRLMGAGAIEPLRQAYDPRSFDAMARAGRDATGPMREAASRLATGSSGVRVEMAPLGGSAEVVRGTRGPLGGPSPTRAAADLAFDALALNHDVYGLSERQARDLELLGESRSPRSGLRTIRLQQVVRGLPVFQSETHVVVDRDGRVVMSVGRLAPGIDESIVPDSGGAISAGEALASALATTGVALDRSRLEVRQVARGEWPVEVRADDPRVVRPVPSRLTYFPLGPGTLVPAWAQISWLRGAAWYTLVDVRTGSLLYRKNLRHDLSSQDARFSVYSQADGTPADSPAPGSPNALTPGSGTQFPAIGRTIRSMLAMVDSTASPDGWIPDGGSVTTGNNADAFLDRDESLSPDLGTLDFDGRPIGNPDAAGRNRDFLGGAPRDFSFTPAPLKSNPDRGDDPSTPAFQRGAVANIFHLANVYHDRLYGFGFDEAAGNYQTNNFHRGGRDADALLLGAQAGADIGDVDNAFFSEAPDGLPGYLGLNMWTGPTPDRDSDLDAEVAYHELTHGLSTRLVGNAAGLNFPAGGGLGEGWSDFYALSLLNGTPADNPDGQYAMGAYSMYRIGFSFVAPASFTDNYVYGVRRFPYSTNNKVNPLTWADADQGTFDPSGGFAISPENPATLGSTEVHNLGEIWALSLWEVRSRVIAAHGGDVAEGSDRLVQIVTDAMKLTPIDPTYTQARDALFDADCAANACANETSIWAGFADRGLGYGARAPLAVQAALGVKESFALPFLQAGTVSLDDTLGNNNGAIDPGETVSIRVSLSNPWRQQTRGVASAAATLTSPTRELTIVDKSSLYGPIAAQGSAFGDPFTFKVSSMARCGQSLDFTLKTTSSLGTTSTTFSLRVGRPAGPGAPITLSRVIPKGLAIPDGTATGVSDTLTVASDVPIDSLVFSVDDLRHPWVGNLIIGLRAPDGFASILISLPAVCDKFGCRFGANDGDNFLLTRIDDAARDDLESAGPSAAPFTGSWLPFLNSPVAFTTIRTGQMGLYAGQNARGPWQIYARDVRAGNAGTLNGWSLIVTPETFTCGP